MANYSTLPGCPEHWTEEQDEALKEAYPAITSSPTITTFKCTTRQLAFGHFPSTTQILLDLRDPYPNAANIISYDLDFLCYRIKRLLSPHAVHTSGFLTTWAKVPRNIHPPICKNGCIASGRCNSRTWQNFSTQEYRCGGCGRMDLTPLPSDPSITATKALIFTASAEARFQAPNTAFAGTPSSTTAARQVDTTVFGPANWTVEHTRHLKESYLTQVQRFTRFSVTSFKLALSIFFPPSATNLDIAALAIDPSTYDLCFLHNQLEKAFGQCSCRENEVSIPGEEEEEEKKCYLRPYVQVVLSNDGMAVACGKCSPEKGVVYAVPVGVEDGMAPTYEGFRCGMCGNTEVKKIEVSDEVTAV
ncbi:MAG: hypothetical protein LQ346_004926 [Caloplaca aetnensis]|nr:MAG: hypothetical protein LQ346_004926 [Caloplaca aetnensis]